MRCWLLILVVATVFAVGCGPKDEPLIRSQEGGTAPATTGTTTGSSPSASGTTGGNAPLSGALSGGTGSSSDPGSGMALPVPDKNPSLDDSGNMITKEEGKPAPEGRVWCDVCGGHFPKEDAVSVAGKTMCPADAEEAKGG